MGAGIPVKNLPQINPNQNLEISLNKETLDYLINKIVETDIPVVNATKLAVYAAAASSFFALLAILQNAKNQKELLVQTVHNQFFEINRDLAERRQSLTPHDYELLINFFDRVGDLIKSKKISLSGAQSFKSMVLGKDIKKFANDYRKAHGSSYFNDYVWLYNEFEKPSRRNISARLVKIFHYLLGK